jgi:hypothetical protein
MEAENVVTTSSLSEVDSPVTATSSESSSSIKATLTNNSNKEASSPLKDESNVSKNKSPQQKPDTRSSDEIRKQLESSKRTGQSDANKQESGSVQENSSNSQEKTEVEDKSKWFDPEKGFKTADDMKKSYSELQTKLTKQSEEVKLEKMKLDIEQAKIREEMDKFNSIKSKRKLTPEEAEKQEAISKWETENKEALDLIEEKLEERRQKKESSQKVQEFNSTIEKQILKERNDWLENFNKDEGRKKLWPVMEQVFKEKGDSQDSVIKDFAKNPLPYIEAMALHKNFASIAEQIKAEAVQQYVAKTKEAAEVERKTKFALPGGPKTGTGDVDISKLSSSEIGSLLQRNENG